MSLLRKDPSTGRWVVFEDRPQEPRPVATACPFCAGNEAMTPPEIAAWGPPGRRANQPGWEVRVVANVRPALRIEEPLVRKAERIRDLKRDTRIRSVFVFKNHGLMAGAAFPGHAHSQVIGLPVTPKALKEMLEGAREHYRLKERCVFCDILREELETGRRVIAASELFVAIAPYASRHPYECWVLPREHSPDFETSAPDAWLNLAALLKALLERLEAALPEPAYNLFLYSGPSRDRRPGYWATLDQDFHWHIAILPRLTEVAGFEVGTGFYANPVIPERAAATLREQL